jgi:acetyl-CoA carboxylase biotin carboxyl carrier protein
MLRCASSLVIAAYATVRLIPQNSRALPAAILRSRPFSRPLKLFTRPSRLDEEVKLKDSITQEDVLQILKMVEASNTDELHLEMGDLKLIIRRANPRTERREGSAGFVTESRSPAFAERTVSIADSQTDKASASSADATEGLIPIQSPMLGTFYKAPKPGAPPFVEVGQWVSEEDTLCIIEVMKLFSTIKAGVRGRVVRICAEDGQMVEFKQTLFLVESVADEGHPG